MTRSTGRRDGVRDRRRSKVAYVFLAPWLLGLLTLTLGPMIASLYLSFTDYDLLTAPKWIGVQNFVFMSEDPNYLQAIRVTALYVVLSVPLRLIVGLAVAMLLNTKLRGRSFYRSAYYLPSLLGASVAVALLWRQLFDRDGVVNSLLLAIFGLHGPSWVTDPDYSLYTIVLLGVWQFGTPMLIFLAGLQQVPGSLLEAASVDGAGAWRRFWAITFPLLTPIILFNLIMQTIGSLQTFSQAYVISGGQGGPAGSTLFYALYLYIEAFGNLKMGYASAMAWILLLVTAVVTAVNFLVSRYWVHYESGATNA